jgi:E3 ubiquitin-protein ligase MYCBP2
MTSLDGALMLQREDSSQSDSTSALVSSIARDVSQSPSGLESPSLSLPSESKRPSGSPAAGRRRPSEPQVAAGSCDSNSSADVARAPLAYSAEDNLDFVPSDLSDHEKMPNDQPQLQKPTDHADRGEPCLQGGERGQQRESGFSPPNGPVPEAMSPSVAESIRAVFAAFIWHEGVVHDTMAVASYLKFHPSLTKEVPVGPDVKGEPKTASLPAAEPPSGTRKKKTTKSDGKRGKQRHSVEVISASYLKAKPHDSVEGVSAATVCGGNSNANVNFNAEKNAATAATRALPELIPLNQALMQIRDSDLPLTLRLLIMLWEEVRSYCSHAITQQVIVASPMLGAKKEANKKDRERRSKSSRKSKTPVNSNYNRRDGGAAEARWRPPPDQHGHARSGAASFSEAPDFYQLCEMCGHYFQHPVTYHMRNAHPGCGGPAGGRGYNSGGSYCGGWAGNCGDGGVGGSSWYLICETCREEHINVHSKLSGARAPPPPSAPSAAPRKLDTSAKNESPLDKFVASKVNAVLGSAFQTATQLRRRPLSMLLPAPQLSSPTGQPSSHLIMRNNAMFLLDLASVSNSNLVALSAKRAEDAHGGEALMSGQGQSLSAVAELAPFDPNPFSLVPFQCFRALGVHSSTLKLINDELTLEEALSDGQGSKDRGQTQGEISPPEQFQNMDDHDSPSKVALARSVSAEGAGSGGKTSRVAAAADHALLKKRMSTVEPPRPVQDLSNVAEARSANQQSSQTSADSFLSNPSTALQKLFDRSPTPTVMADVLQRPVMSFVLQWNDLESLQLAMTVALRKAACRTYAMQALNWLLRSVSQPASLHDLLWCLVSALESSGDPLAGVVTSPPHPTMTVESLGNQDGAEHIKERKNKKNSVAAAAAAVAAATPNQGAAAGAAVLAARSKTTASAFPELCEHPISDVYIVGASVHSLTETFHSLLQVSQAFFHVFYLNFVF